MMKKTTSKKIKRSLIEWGGIAAVAAVLYFTGLHTEVIGGLQRALLWTGLFDAQTQQQVDGTSRLTADDYSTGLLDSNGDAIRLDQYRGKVLFINMWATWCPPCVAEMPTIQKLYDRVSGNDDIRFLLISQDEDHAKAVKFMKRKGFSMPYYFPSTRLPAVLQSSYIPSTFVISKEGQIIYQKEGIADYGSEEFSAWLVKQAE